MRLKGPRAQRRPGLGCARAGRNVSNFQGNTSPSPSDASSASEKRQIQQQLDPLTADDLAQRSVDDTSSLLPQDEIEKDVVVQNLTYRTPKSNRRRPGNALQLALINFREEFMGLVKATKQLEIFFPRTDVLPDAFGFTLSNQAIHEFDQAHPAPGREPAPAPIRWMYSLLLYFVDEVFKESPIGRFWFLETVARMPYFAYTSVLHLYESLGWWRTGGLRLVHFAEEWNELHHLLIMEALGGDRKWQDRFLGEHGAILYYWVLTIAFFISPKWSYKFSEMLEVHAVSTYRQFIIENGDKLKQLPAPKIAQHYYLSQDPYLYNLDSALARGPTNEAPRKPPCDNLYDVFVNILEDEWEHVKTMVMCQDYDLLESLKVTQTEFTITDTNTHDYEARRQLWNQWAKDLNLMDEMIKVRKM